MWHLTSRWEKNCRGIFNLEALSHTSERLSDFTLLYVIDSHGVQLVEAVRLHQHDLHLQDTVPRRVTALLCVHCWCVVHGETAQLREARAARTLAFCTAWSFSSLCCSTVQVCIPARDSSARVTARAKRLSPGNRKPAQLLTK
jgi:hypothetical protein